MKRKLSALLLTATMAVSGATLVACSNTTPNEPNEPSVPLLISSTLTAQTISDL